MAKNPRVSVVGESESGRNTRFRDNQTGREMSRPEFVRRIQDGDYDGYHVRRVNGVPTPASDPDNKKGNNLG
jgi:Protein of unknown function (DUF3892)